MSQIRCPRRACRRRKADVVSTAFLITDDGAVIYTAWAQPHTVNLATGRWARPEFADFTNGQVAYMPEYEAARSVPPHFRCVCGHRYVHSGGVNRTLETYDARIYDAFEVAALVKGERGGWHPSDNGRRR